MWTAAGVALVSIVALVMSFLSRGKALKQVGQMAREIEENELLIEALMEEIEALRLGDHGLEHGDMLDVVLPPNLRDDAVDDS